MQDPDKVSPWIKSKNKLWGGKHFHLPGDHAEEGMIFNPFIGYTSAARVDRFGYDHWLMQLLGIRGKRAASLVAETVEQLSPHKKIEILVR